MKKVISKCLYLLATVALCIPLTACHGSKGKEAFVMPEAFDETQKISISFWAKNDTNKTQVEIYKNAIKEFEKAYPNITVNLKLYTDYGKIYNDVITNISTDTTPNVCITYPDHIATYMSGKNVVVPLDELIANEKYGLSGSEIRFDSPSIEEIVPQFIDECKIDDTTLALPFMRSTEACYINKELVEKLGYSVPDVVTWDFMWEVAEKAIEKDSDGVYKVNNQKVMIPIIYKSTDNMMIQYLKQKQAGYSTIEGGVEIFNDETTAFLNEVAKHGATGAFSTFAISSYPGNFLNASQCIFAIDSTAGSTWMGYDAPLQDIDTNSVPAFTTEVRMTPQADVNNIQMISQGPSVCLFNKSNPQEVMASWLFMQYLITNDVQVAYSKTEGYVPVTIKAQKSDEYREYIQASGSDKNEHYEVKIQATKLLVDNVDSTFVTPVFNGSTSLRSAAGQLIENVVKSARRNQSIDDAYFEKMYSDVSSLYRLDSTSAAVAGKVQLGPLPGEAVALLTTLGVIWLFIIIYVVYKAYIKKKNS